MQLLALVTLDYVVLAAYLLLMVAMGLAFSRRQESSNEFFLAGRSMGWFPVGISVMATLLSALSYSGVPGESYFEGFHYLILPAMVWVCVPLMVKVVLPLYHNLQMYSVYEYLELRFDVRTRVVSSIVFVIWRLLWMGGVLYAPCKVLIIAAGVNVPEPVLLLSLGLIGTIYTFLGGMRAVIWTDVLQAFVMVAGVVLILWGTWSSIDGGLATVLGTASQKGRGEILETQFSWSSKWSVWGMAPHMLISMLSFYIADQITVQRFLTARSLKASTRSFLLNCVSVTIMIPALALVGVSLFAYYQHHPDQMRPIWVANVVDPASGTIASDDAGAALLDWSEDGTAMDMDRPEDAARVQQLIADGRILRPHTGEPFTDPARIAALTEGESGRLQSSLLGKQNNQGEWVVNRKAQDEFMPRFLTDKLGVGIAGLILAALFAASMSSMDSGLNSISTLVITDFHRRWGWGRKWLAKRVGKEAGELTEEDELRLARPLVLVIGVLATLFSMTLGHVGNIFDIMIAIINTFGGPLLAIFILGMFTRVTSGRSALVALLVGTLFTLWIMASNSYASLAHLWPFAEKLGSIWPVIFGFGFTILVGTVGGLILGGRKTDSELRGLVVGIGTLGDRGPEEASRVIFVNDHDDSVPDSEDA